MSKPQQTVVIFNPKDDRWLIGSGLICLALLIGLALFRFEPLTQNSKNLITFYIRDLLFFHTLHVPISFVFFFKLPEFQQWARLTERKFFRSFTFDMLTVFLLFFTIVLVMKLLPADSNEKLWMVVTFSYIYIFFKFLHSVGQVRGLSAILNKKSLELDPQSVSAIRCEKYFFKAFFISIQIFAVAYFFITRGGKADSSSWLAIGSKIPFIVSICFLAGLLLNSFRFPKEISLKKFLFLSRLIFVPVSYLFPVAIFFVAVCHGTEYFFTAKQMHQKTSATADQKKQILWLSGLVGILWVCLVIPFYQVIPDLHLNSVILAFLLAIARAFDYTHYWMDRLIFQMRETPARDNQGRLLL